MIQFKNWLFLNENIESDFDLYLANIVKYAKPGDAIYNLGKEAKEYFLNKEFSSDAPGQSFRKIIIQVLKEKHLENYNWFSFAIGFYTVKKFRKEDLALAIDVTKKLIDSGKLPKSEIGAKGWFEIGRESKEKVEEYLKSTQQISNRKERKLRKLGSTFDEDEKLIKLVAQEDVFKLYYLHSLGEGTEYGLPKDEDEIKARKRVLCKYGKGTNWCTAAPDGDYHEHYLGNNIYIVHENNKPVYQFVSCLDEPVESHQFMDAKDDEVKELKLNVYQFLKKYASNVFGCYEVSVPISAEEFVDSKTDEDIKAKATGKNLAEILNSSKHFSILDRKKIISRAEEISRNVKFLDSLNLVDLFLYSDDLSLIEQIVGRKNITDYLNHSRVFYVISHSDPDRLEELFKVLGKENIEKLNSRDVINLLLRLPSERISNLLGKEIIEKLQPEDVYYFLSSIFNRPFSFGVKKKPKSAMETAIDIIGINNVRKLTSSEIDGIFNTAYSPYSLHRANNGIEMQVVHPKSKSRQENAEYLMKILVKAGSFIPMSSTYAILANSSNVVETIKTLGSENFSRLWHQSIKSLLDKESGDKKKLAKTIQQYYKVDEKDSTETRLADNAKVQNLLQGILEDEF